MECSRRLCLVCCVCCTVLPFIGILLGGFALLGPCCMTYGVDEIRPPGGDRYEIDSMYEGQSTTIDCPLGLTVYTDHFPELYCDGSRQMELPAPPAEGDGWSKEHVCGDHHFTQHINSNTYDVEWQSWNRIKYHGEVEESQVIDWGYKYYAVYCPPSQIERFRIERVPEISIWAWIAGSLYVCVACCCLGCFAPDSEGPSPRVPSWQPSPASPSEVGRRVIVETVIQREIIIET